MKASELVKVWETQNYPNFPKPEFNIGDIVKITDNDDEDDLAVVVGIRLRYYSYSRRHAWYYEIADHISCPSVTIDWFDEEKLEPAKAKTDSQKWHTIGGEVPIVPVCECWNCGKIRVDDNMDCPYCSADRIQF